jgi:hypothetical protein
MSVTPHTPSRSEDFSSSNSNIKRPLLGLALTYGTSGYWHQKFQLRKSDKTDEKQSQEFYRLGLHSLLSNGYLGLFLGGKAAGA